MPSTTTYTWDEENRLTNITLPNGGNEEYSYAADGMRRSKSVNGQTTRFVWDAENLLQEQRDSQPIAHYTNQPDGYGPLLSQQRSDGGSAPDAQFNAVSFGAAAFNQSRNAPAAPTSSFYGFDLSANTRVLTDANGDVSDQYISTAFGKPISVNGNTSNSYRFGGEVGYYQDSSNKSYVRARYLNTSQGKWISRDPIGFEGRDWNLYRYVSNDPVNFFDPSGLEMCKICGPEIGPSLREALLRAHYTYTSWSLEDQAQACDSLIKIPTSVPEITDVWANTAWDVTTLYSGNIHRMLLAPFLKLGCAAHLQCSQTVMVDGQCHKAWAVNYVYYGMIMKICRDKYPVSKLKTETVFNGPLRKRKVLIPVAKNKRQAVLEQRFGRSKLIDAVGGWKTFQAMRPGGKEAGYKLKDANQALDWAQLGYYNIDNWTNGGGWRPPLNAPTSNASPYTPKSTHPQCKKCKVPERFVGGNPERLGGFYFRLTWGNKRGF